MPGGAEGQAAVVRAVTGQIDWWWNGIFRPRLLGLSDEELVWEPEEGCWNLHDAGEGLSRVDSHWPPPRPAPVTTIGWRMQHIAVGCLAHRTSIYFPDLVPEPWEVERYSPLTPFPLDAEAALAFLERWWSAWREGVGSLTEEGLWRPLGGVEGDYPEMQLGTSDPFIGMVLHQHRELMHHGAEICLLRDLYRARQPKDPFLTAVLRGDRDTVDRLCGADPSLVDRYRQSHSALVLRAAETGNPAVVTLAVELGFDPNDLSEGQTALHHLVAGGYEDLVLLLLSLGADPTVRDKTFQADVLGWATYFNQTRLEELLRSRLGSPAEIP